MSKAIAQPVRYPNTYVWFVFVSTLDICLTWIVLHSGGFEANAIADSVIRRFGLVGLVGFKLALTTLFVLVCELVGRRNDEAGRSLATVGVGIASLPVLIAFLLLHH